ncbi:MAG: cyclase family protein [Alphaproteobacteria bacterium]
MAPRWKHRPEGSNWGDFGPDDEVGRLNLITPARRLAAVREVREGIAFCLSLPLDLPGGNALVPDRHPPRRGIETRAQGAPFVHFPMALEDPHWTDVSCDDSVTLYTQYSTQWDGLAHVGTRFDADGDGEAEVVYYNGFRAGVDVVGPQDAAAADGGPGARRLGIEKMAETCVQGRGVLIDLHAHFGSDRRLVDHDALMGVMVADGVTVEPGDMLCLHTGYGQAILDMAGDPDPRVLHNSHAALDGQDERLLRWIDESGIALLIADNFAVEGFPYPERPAQGCQPGLPVHQACLFRLGIHLGEIWYLSELAAWLRAHGRSRFLLTAPPLRLPGSFGSPVTPVATV